MKVNKYGVVVAFMVGLCVGLILLMININREEIKSNISHTINETKKETEFFGQSDHINTLKPEETESFPEKNTEEIDDYPKLIEENQLYKITCEADGYYCYFYNFDRNVTQEKGPMLKMPRLKVVDNNYVKLTVQAGTGRSTQWGYYYDAKNNRFSETFEWIFDEFEGLVAYGDYDGENVYVTVRDIFDKTVFYQEIKNFKNEFSVAIEPIVNVEFVGNNTISVTYLTGEDYQKVTELFTLE